MKRFAPPSSDLVEEWISSTARPLGERCNNATDSSLDTSFNTIDSGESAVNNDHGGLKSALFFAKCGKDFFAKHLERVNDKYGPASRQVKRMKQKYPDANYATLRPDCHHLAMADVNGINRTKRGYYGWLNLAVVGVSGSRYLPIAKIVLLSTASDVDRKRIDNNEVTGSQLCGDAYCINRDHIIMESLEAAKSRKACQKISRPLSALQSSLFTAIPPTSCSCRPSCLFNHIQQAKFELWTPSKNVDPLLVDFAQYRGESAGTSVLVDTCKSHKGNKASI